MIVPDEPDFSNDQALFALARRELFSAVIGDVMDTLGLQRQFLPPRIQPLRQDMIVIGRAMTVLEADLPPARRSTTKRPTSNHSGTNHAAPRARRAASANKRPAPAAKRPAAANSPAARARRIAPIPPFGRMLEALDDLKPGEVYLCTGSSPSYALWGELMSTRAMKLGATGAVVDGYSRDTRGICNLDFPVFSHGRYAQDQGPRGHVVDYRVPITIGGVRVDSGDIVFGDLDGVCIIPRPAEREVFRLALAKARGEQRVARAIRDGMSAVQAFDTFGIM